MATLVGGMIFWTLVLSPAAGRLPPGEGSALLDRAAAAFRPLLFFAMGGLLLSGIINYWANPVDSKLYQALIGIKFLFVAHVFAVAYLIGKPVNSRRTRLATGAMISCLIILAISACLRRIH
jgi:CDP-diglyceride synthetase